VFFVVFFCVVVVFFSLFFSNLYSSVPPTHTHTHTHTFSHFSSVIFLISMHRTVSSQLRKARSIGTTAVACGVRVHASCKLTTRGSGQSAMQMATQQHFSNSLTSATRTLTTSTTKSVNISRSSVTSVMTRMAHTVRTWSRVSSSCKPFVTCTGAQRAALVQNDAATATSAEATTNTHTSVVDESTMEAHRMAVKSLSDGRAIYLDMQSTTPTDPRVVDAMLPYFSRMYGNPHSRTHMYGWEAEKAVEVARKQVAELVGADSREIIFTSGATESNNCILKGIAKFYGAKKRHIITTQTEHKCVLDSCRQLELDGFEVTYLPVQQDGLVDLKVLEDAIRPDTAVVSVMMVHNEIGVIQPVKEIGAICRKNKVFFHTDAAQALGKVPIDVNDMNIDVMSLSGHKIYGPMGIGAMYVRRRPRVRLVPLIHGGGQERGMRSGTLPTPLAVGFGEACRIAQEEMQKDKEHIDALSKRLYESITSRVTDVTLNGSAEHRYHGNLNLSFAYVEGESMLMALKDVAVSSGSACTSASLEPSYVLRALGVEEDLAHTSIRFGIGRFTTEAEIDYAADLVVKHVERLREMSPLYEMVQEGIDIKSIQWTT
jgi:cysteine desulfurase